ncbi:MAG: hypothetical protein KAI66_26190, partial [Lentisphaeria bacterium]|nr:hypothetical protein [Lentisphaeria bacterium]
LGLPPGESLSGLCDGDRPWRLGEGLGVSIDSLFDNYLGLPLKAAFFALTGMLVLHGSPPDLWLFTKVMTGVSTTELRNISLQARLCRDADRGLTSPRQATLHLELPELIGLPGETHLLRQQFADPEGSGVRQIEIAATPAWGPFCDTMECELACRLWGDAEGAPIAETKGAVLLVRGGGLSLTLPGSGGQGNQKSLYQLRVKWDLINPGGVTGLCEWQTEEAAEGEGPGQERMRSQLSGILVKDLSFHDPTLRQVVGDLRTYLRRRAPGSTATNLVLAGETLSEPDAPVRRIEGDLNLSGLTLLEALELIHMRFGTPATVLDTAVLIDHGPEPERTSASTSAPPKELLDAYLARKPER